MYLFIHCSKRQPDQQNEELPPEAPAQPTTSNSIDPSKPDVVYAHIVQSRNPALGNANVSSDNEPVIYAELQLSKANDVHTVSPSVI